MSTLTQFNDALENAPAFPSTPMAKDLAGWRLADGHHVCVTCTARRRAWVRPRAAGR